MRCTGGLSCLPQGVVKKQKHPLASFLEAHGLDTEGLGKGQREWLNVALSGSRNGTMSHN